jgi:hypothetical protein
MAVHHKSNIVNYTVPKREIFDEKPRNSAAFLNDQIAIFCQREAMLLSLIYVSRSLLALPSQAEEVDKIVTESTERNSKGRKRRSIN